MDYSTVRENSNRVLRLEGRRGRGDEGVVVERRYCRR